jgi:hypothetical protein
MCTGVTHEAGRHCVMSIQSRHVMLIDATSTENRAVPPFLFLSSFLSPHLVVVSLAILSSLPKSETVMREIDSMSWYPNYIGYVRRLYRLILLYFEIFVLMNLCGGNLR